MDGKSLVRDSGDEGMVPLFNFMNSFVDGVYPETIGEFIEDNGITSIDGFGDLSVQDYVVLFIGGAVCAAIGVLFFVLLPVCGCCYCCCRTCCGCCQPQKKQPAKQPSSCKKWTCLSILFLLISCMLSAVICSFVATSMVNDEFSEDGVFNDIVVGLEGMEDYLHDSVDDVDVAIFPPLNETIVDVFSILDQLPETTVNTFAKDTGIDPALYSLQTYTNNLGNLNQNLTVMNDARTDLDQYVTDMDTDLANVQSAIEPFLTSCIAMPEAQAQCQELQDRRPDLVSDATYGSLDDVTVAVATTQAAITAGVPAAVSGFVVGFEAIEDTINTTISSDVNELKKTVIEVRDDIKQKFDEFASDVKDISVDDLTQEIKDIQPDVEYYASLGANAFYGISALLLIFVLLYLIGIPMGAFGSPHTAKHGANCIMAAIAFTFLFGSVFMLITTVMFVLGSAAQAGGCRHLIAYDESMQSLEKLLRKEYGRDIPYNLTVSELLESCKQDEAIYTAFRLEQNGFNVSELLDLDNTELPKYIDQLKNITIDVGTIEVINDQVNDSILAIDAATQAIDFDEYLAEVAKPVTKTDVKEYEELVREAAGLIEPVDPVLANDLRLQADELNKTHADHIAPMEPLRASLGSASEASKEISSSVSLSQVMGDLTRAQGTLNTDSNKMIQAIIGSTADTIYKDLNDLFDGFIHSIKNDIAGCLPAYDALTTVAYGPCVYFLYPYNAIWFTYGWYLAFGFFALFFGTSAVGMFRVKAVGRKISSSDIPMQPLYSGYQTPKNAVSPQGSQVVISEPPPDYSFFKYA